MIVVDASVVTTALVDDEAPGQRVRSRLSQESLVAPDLVYLEVISAVRRLHAAGLAPKRCQQAIDDLLALPIVIVSHEQIVKRCWELRGAITPYDAAYIAVAEAFAIPLVTGDARLSRAPKLRCQIELLA